MKKSELRQIIKEEYAKVLKEKTKPSLKEQDDDFEDEDEIDESWAEQDGWNQEFFEEIGLIDLLDNFSRVTYELQNARRGSYGINGDTLEDLKDTLMELSEELQDMINNLD